MYQQQRYPSMINTSDLVAKLETGVAYSFSDYTVSVGKIDIGKGTAEITVLPAGQNSCNI